MMIRLAPESVSQIPKQFSGIYSHGIEVRNAKRLLFLSGQIGVSPKGVTLDGFDAQTRQAMDNVEALLGEADMDQDDIVKVVYYVTDASNIPALSNLRLARWGQGQGPTVTTLVVAGLAAPDLLVEIEVTACKTKR